MSLSRLGWLALALSAAALAAQAQLPPAPSEIVAYSGLHAAAQRGDVAAIDGLAPGSRAALEARDAHGRTPLHVATFARQRAAARARSRQGPTPGRSRTAATTP